MQGRPIFNEWILNSAMIAMKAKRVFDFTSVLLQDQATHRWCINEIRHSFQQASVKAMDTGYIVKHQRPVPSHPTQHVHNHRVSPELVQ